MPHESYIFELFEIFLTDEFKKGPPGVLHSKKLNSQLYLSVFIGEIAILNSTYKIFHVWESLHIARVFPNVTR